MSESYLLDGINKQVQLARDDNNVALFDSLLNQLEFLIKLVTSGLLACVREDKDRQRYSLEYKLVRADNLGDWVGVLTRVLTGPSAELFFTRSQDIKNELNGNIRAEDWRYSVLSQLISAASIVGVERKEVDSRMKLRQFFEIGVQIRNRVAHGAPTYRQKSDAVGFLDSALQILTQELQLFKIPWAYIHQNQNSTCRIAMFSGDSSCFGYLKERNRETIENGVYIFLNEPVRVNLLYSGPDLEDIWFPNGKFKTNVNKFDVLSYISNNKHQEDGKKWSEAVESLPKSSTEGEGELGHFGSGFGNVPPLQRAYYIPRPDLVDTVCKELMDSERHPILTLTGPGGIGKTTITLAALYKLKDDENFPYETVLWISARDIDLLESGPRRVSQRVGDLSDIVDVVVDWLGVGPKNLLGKSRKEYVEDCLTEGALGTTLFVLDNFETIQNPGSVYSWIDEHIRLPNKVVITTRIRDFRGDYPIQIGGMTNDQAGELVDQHAKRLNILNHITDEYKQELIEESRGHPYALLIWLGTVATQGRRIAPKKIWATSDQILQALFDRTYSALSNGARRAFLLLSSWQVYVPEVAITGLLLRSDDDRLEIDEAMLQLERFSLIDRINAEEDEQALVTVPLAASTFGRSKLAGSPLRASVEEDSLTLKMFGFGHGKLMNQNVLPRIRIFYNNIEDRSKEDKSILDQHLSFLEYLASQIPRAYVDLSDLLARRQTKEDLDRSKEYLLRSIEQIRDLSRIEKSDIFEKLAERCHASHDTIGEIHAMCEITLASLANPIELNRYVSRLNSRVKELKDQRNEIVDSSEFQDLLGGVINGMERYLVGLSADNCSSLAWLYIHLDKGNEQRPYELALTGLRKDPDNEHCKKLKETAEQRRRFNQHRRSFS